MNSIKSKLLNIHHLGVKKVSQAILKLCQYNYQRMIPSLIEQCIDQHKTKETAILYLQLIDKLLDYEGMTNLLSGCILTTYPEIVKYLSENNGGFELGRAKMMRKKWVGGKIHPGLYSDLKEAVEKKVGIDIDQFASYQSVLYLETFYAHKLKLTPKEIHHYLPESTIGLAEDCVPGRKMIKINEQNVFKSPLQSSQSSADLQESEPQDNLQQSKESLRSDLSVLIQECRRTRQMSLDTNYPDSDYQETYRKMASNDESIVRVKDSFELKREQERMLIIETKQQLSLLRAMNPHSCKECGKQYFTKEAMKTHSQEHVKSRLKYFRQHEATKARIKQKNRLTAYMRTLDKWTKDVSPENNYWITIEGTDPHDNHLCAFCQNVLKVSFKQDQWRLMGVIRVQLCYSSEDENRRQDQEEKFMHYKCAKALKYNNDNELNWELAPYVKPE